MSKSSKLGTPADRGEVGKKPGEKKVPEVRPKHPDKELEALLCDVEAHGWRIMKGKQYFKAYCPCADQHLKTIHLSPSGSMYLTNTRKWFERQPCWKEES